MEILKKLQTLEGMDLLVDKVGNEEFPIVEINNCSIQKCNNKYYIYDEDDDISPVAFNEKVIDYIEVLSTGEEIIHLIYDSDIRIMFH